MGIRSTISLCKKLNMNLWVIDISFEDLASAIIRIDIDDSNLYKTQSQMVCDELFNEFSLISYTCDNANTSAHVLFPSL